MGNPQFSQQGTQGGGQTVAVSNRPEIESATGNQTGSVASGNWETVEVYAPTGSVYRGLALFMMVLEDSNATSGTHKVLVKTDGRGITSGESVYNSRVQYSNGQWSTADSSVAPTDATAQAMIPDRMIATENAPIAFKYKNATDAAQDNDRRYEYVFREDTY